MNNVRGLVIDLFAGGGGMSEAILNALGFDPDYAINHDDDAISMHRKNHPNTIHYVTDVYDVDPHEVCQGRPVLHLHASPDCTDHSQAKGGQPRSEKRRSLAWVVIMWIGKVKPERLSMENVKQFKKWGPLVAKRCKDTGRVITLEKIQNAHGKMVNRVANPGERVPREMQYLVPDRKREGQTYKRFKHIIESYGYQFNDGMMNAADWGAGTGRDRLFIQARRDSIPVTFPEAPHAKKPRLAQKKWSPAYEHIDFDRPCTSIFGRKKPLANATLNRIAKGMVKFVINNPDPFIIQTSNTNANGSYVREISEPLGTLTTRNDTAIVEPLIVQVTQSSNNGVRSASDPLPTITTAKGGEFALAAPVLVQIAHGDGQDTTKRWGIGTKSVRETLGTFTASGSGHAVAEASLEQLSTGFMYQANGGFYTGAGNDLRSPLSTITNTGSQQQLVMANLLELRNNKYGSDLKDTISTITTSGAHHGLVEYELSQEVDWEKAGKVASFLLGYYGTENMYPLDQPLPTITTKDRIALVLVYYNGATYAIVDIKMRMLDPSELKSATGFRKDYVITHGHDGRKFSKAKQVKMIGNAVSPLPGEGLIKHMHRDWLQAA